MQLETISSRAIHAVGYDAERRLLEVVFNTGRIYQFVNVPPEIFKSLMSAESKGDFFTRNIRDAYAYWSFHAPRTTRPLARRPRRGAAR